MSDSTDQFSKHKRLPNICRESRMTIRQGVNIGPYEILDLLKEGSSSKVYLAKSKYTNEKVAIKAIKKSRFNNNLEDILLITKQIETLKVLKHRNIVTLYEIYESKKYIYLVTEYLSGKDLIEKLIKKKRFNEEEALRIFFQLLDAFTYMHKMNICHLNLRVEHILFDKNNRPKIIGFGYSSFYEKEKNIEGSYGSLCYVCPEIIDEKPYNPELADVWSLGVILYVLICGYLPFSDEDDNKNKILISNGKVEFPKEISNKLKDLLRHMLDKNPKKRYTFQKIIKHPWLKPYSEKIFSEGINIYKTIFPVDERILNIIKEYGFDRNKVKDDLIKNKFNIGTGLFKQIVRKLLDLKMKNISDLWSEEFMAYRDDKKNKIEDGDKKYEEYIKKIDEKYKKREDFVNNFKEREDYVVERLMYLKDKKEEKKKDRLNTIEEAIIDFVDEDENEKNNKSFKGKDDEDKIQQNNIRNVKTERTKLLPKSKTPMLNLGELMSIRKKNLSGNIESNDNIEIIYNKDDQDVDIIQQFQEKQYKKTEKTTIEKSPSTPNLGKKLETNKDIDQKTNQFKLFNTPEKKGKFATKILEQELDTKETKDLTYSTLSNNIKSSLYSNKNSLSSNISNIHCFNNGKINKNYNRLISNITLKTLTSQNSNASFFRMTSKSNSKACLDRSSLYDDFLKKNHPDNIRKTILKNSFFSNMNKIDEGNDDSESEKEKENKEKKENGLKDSGKLRYSLSFGDDDEDEEDEDDSIGSKETDLKLFNILENENDEELQELKKIYFEDKADKSLKKSMIKKKSVRFNEDTSKRKEKSSDSILKKSNFSKKTFVSSISNSVFDKFEERLKRYNKTYKITSDKEETGPLKLDISFNDDDTKLKTNNSDYIIKFNRDKITIKKLDFLKIEEFGFDLDDINRKVERNYIFTISENPPIKKINIKNNPKNKKINDNIDKIHSIFTKKNKNKKNKEIAIQKDKSTLEKKERKKSLNKANSKNKPKKENTKRKSRDNNFIIQKKDETAKKNKGEISGFSITEKIKQDNFIIYSEYAHKNKEEIYHFPKTKTEKIKQDNFSIYPDIKSSSNSNLDDNYFNSNTYNGNLPIDTSKYNNATLNENIYNSNIINYDILLNKNNDSNNSTIKERSTFYPEKKHIKERESKDFNMLSNNKSYTCFSYNAKKNNNVIKTSKKNEYKIEANTAEPNTLKTNKKKCLKPKSPRMSNVPKDIKKYVYSTRDKKLEKNNTNSQLQLFKSHYKKYQEMTNSLFSIEEPNFQKNLAKKRRGFSSEKNIIEVEKEKRDEIIAKFENCHNLLNTLKEQKNFMTLNKNKNIPKMDKLTKTSSFYKKFETINYNERPRSRKKIIDMKKDINKVNKFEINDNNNDNGIKQIYIKNNNEKKFSKNINYKKINNNNNNDNKNSYDYLHKEKNFNTILLPKNFSINNNSSLNMRACLRNENNSHNNSSFNNRQMDNYSFDNHQKQLSNIKEEEYISPNKRAVGLYKKNEKDKKQSDENGSFNKTYNSNFNKKYENSFKNNKNQKDNKI